MRIFFVLLFGFVTMASVADAKMRLPKCFRGGCDLVWEANRRIDKGIQSKSEALVGPAKQAFLEVTEKFYSDFNKALDKIDGIAKTHLKSAKAIADELIGDAERLIELAAIKASEVVDDTVEKIRDQIIKETATQLKTIIGLVDDKIKTAIETARCEFQGFTTSTTLELNKLFNMRNIKFPFPIPSFSPLNRCNPTIDVDGKVDLMKMWESDKCNIMAAIEKIDRIVTVRDIRNVYLRLTELSKQYACAALSPQLRDAILRDYQHFAEKYDLWDLAAGRPR